MDSVYVFSQIKQLNANFTNFQQTTMQTIQHLSSVVVDMQEKIDDIHHLLTSLANNQEVAV